MQASAQPRTLARARPDGRIVTKTPTKGEEKTTNEFLGSAPSANKQPKLTARRPSSTMTAEREAIDVQIDRAFAIMLRIPECIATCFEQRSQPNDIKPSKR